MNFFEKQIIELAARRGWQIERDWEYLNVRCHIFVTTKKRLQTFGGWVYAAFNSEGVVIAVGEELADNRAGGWSWIRGRFDNRADPSLNDPPEDHPLAELWG